MATLALSARSQFAVSVNPMDLVAAIGAAFTDTADADCAFTKGGGAETAATATTICHLTAATAATTPSVAGTGFAVNIAIDTSVGGTLCGRTVGGAGASVAASFR